MFVIFNFGLRTLKANLRGVPSPETSCGAPTPPRTTLALPLVPSHNGEILEKIEKLNNNTKEIAEISEESLAEQEVATTVLSPPEIKPINAETVELSVSPNIEPPCVPESLDDQNSLERSKPSSRNSVRLENSDIDDITIRQKTKRDQVNRTREEQALRSIELVKRIFALRTRANNGEDVDDERLTLPRPPYFQEETSNLAFYLYM